MQIDVNSAADRAPLMRVQLTSLRSAQLNPKTPVSTDGRTSTGFDSVRRTSTDLVSKPGKNISAVRANPPVTRAPTIVPMPRTVQPDRTGTTSPTPRRIVGPDVDFKSSAQTVTTNPVVSDPGSAEPVNRLGALLAKLAGGGSQRPQEPHGDVADSTRPIDQAPAEPKLSDPSYPSKPRVDPVEPLDPVDALLADWGKKDSPYDFDKNGIVGVNDLLILLGRLTSAGSPPPQEPHGDVASPRRPSAETPAQLKTPVDHAPVIRSGDPVAIGVKATTIAQQVIDQLDQNDSGTIAAPEVGSTPRFDRLDRNHDGALSRSELAAQIRNMLLDHIAMSPNAKLDQFVREAMKRLSDHDNRNGAPGERDAAVQRSSQAYQRMNLDEIAHKLMQQLTDYGPSDLANFVQAGELSANDTKVVVNRISMLSPDKLGVNVVG